MLFKDLNVEVENTYKSFDYKGKEVKVIQYLPLEDRLALIDVTLRKSYEDGVYNPMKMWSYFDLHIVFLYSDILFDEEDREDELALFDALELSGLINQVVMNMAEGEYKQLQGLLQETYENKQKEALGISSVLGNLIGRLPVQLEQATQFLKDFDPAKFEELQKFVKAINNGNHA
jgi:hypothetical protein